MTKRADTALTCGARLRTARRRKNWTREDLKKATDIPLSELRSFEEGRSLPSAPRLLASMGIELEA